VIGWAGQAGLDARDVVHDVSPDRHVRAVAGLVCTFDGQASVSHSQIGSIVDSGAHHDPVGDRRDSVGGCTVGGGRDPHPVDRPTIGGGG